MKKEIKKLQKFRDQIKTWQGNDSLEATIAPQKLQEHRRLVEEAMECYKEVEKTSKMKSYSNQSIMLAALDTAEHEMSPEVREVVEFLREIESELSDQNEKLDEEYEKLSQKKVRKNNLLAIEERKQELETFKQKNEFHLERIQMLVNYLKFGKLSPESVWTIQDDLKFYIESNQDPDYMDDETMYDELIKEAKENSEKNATVAPEGHSDAADVSLSNGQGDSTTFNDSLSRTDLQPQEQHPNKNILLSSSPVAESPNLSSQASTDVPSKQSNTSSVATPKGKLIPNERKEIIDTSSPAFITTLKPATAPTKPVGALKWSLAAAGASKGFESPSTSRQTSPEKSEVPKSSDTETTQVEKSLELPEKPLSMRDESNASSELLSLLTKNDEFSSYLEALKNSNISSRELGLFGDTTLLKLPPGIQDLAVGITSSKRNDKDRILSPPLEYKPLRGETIPKSYHPAGLFPSGRLSDPTFKVPLFLSKLQSYWNRIRALNQFEELADEIGSLEENQQSGKQLVNELTLVLFYGFYFGFLPLENIIADSLLFKLGWRPYKLSNPNRLDQSTLFEFWLKPLNANVQTMGNGTQTIEVGDYRVFDLSSWEIYVKYGFKFDPSLSRQSPLGTIN